MLTKYPNSLKLYKEIPYVKEFLSKNFTAERLHQLHNYFVDRRKCRSYTCIDYLHAHREFVWEVIRLVLRSGGFQWFRRVCEEYPPNEKNIFSLFSVVLEIEYGIPSYRA